MKHLALRITLLSAVLALATFVLAACGSPAATDTAADSLDTTPATAPLAGQGHGPRMGQGSMASRHHVSVPEPYAGMTNPVPADEASFERAAEQYSLLCAGCHGDGGSGDGPAGAGLDPAPAPVAHTSQNLGDDHLFWRISEGGAAEPFSSGMPAWKDLLDEQARWDLINYMRALGTGQVEPRQTVGGETWDPERERAERAAMLDAGVTQGVITRAEADLFDQVHTAMDELRAASTTSHTEDMEVMRAALLADLVAAGTITQAQAEVFNDIHARLEEAGLMQ